MIAAAIEAVRRSVPKMNIGLRRIVFIYSNELSELLDVRLMAMSPQAFTLAGFERVADVEYGQSWLVSSPKC